MIDRDRIKYVIPNEDTHPEAFLKVNKNFDELLNIVEHAGVCKMRESFTTTIDNEVTFTLQKGCYILGTNSLQVIINGKLLIAGNGIYELNSKQFKLMENVPVGTEVVAIYSYYKERYPVEVKENKEPISNYKLNVTNSVSTTESLLKDEFSSYQSAIIINDNNNFEGETPVLVKGNYQGVIRWKMVRLQSEFNLILKLSEINSEGETNTTTKIFYSSVFVDEFNYIESYFTINIGKLAKDSKLLIQISTSTDNSENEIAVDYVSIEKAHTLI